MSVRRISGRSSVSPRCRAARDVRAMPATGNDFARQHRAEEQPWRSMSRRTVPRGRCAEIAARPNRSLIEEVLHG